MSFDYSINNAKQKPGVEYKGIDNRWGAGKTGINELLSGQQVPWDSNNKTRNLVASLPMHDGAVEISEDYEKKALMSIDGLLRPVSVLGANGELSAFGIALGNCQITSDKGAQPPIDREGEAGNLDQYNVDIDTTYLNPFANPSTDLPTDHSDTSYIGHDIEIAAHGSEPTEYGLKGPIAGYAATDDTAESQYSLDDDYRLICLRAPLILQGWGYDLDGKPIPNKVDSAAAAKGGNFVSSGLKDKFMDDWLRKSESWPVGPVDLRWDRERAVWTVPQYRDLFVELLEDIEAGGSGRAKRTEGPDLYDSDGATMTNPEVIAVDKTDTSYNEGDKVIVRWDPQQCFYYILGGGGCSEWVQVVTDVYLTDDALVIEKGNIKVCEFIDLYTEEIPLVDCEDDYYGAGI